MDDLFEDDYFTFPSGKRWFQANGDSTVPERFKVGEISPSGPMAGYKVPFTSDETSFLERHGIDAASLRAWGKSAKGTRRPLFIKAIDVSWKPLEDGKAEWSFSLPSGAYATTYFIAVWQPEMLLKPEAEWPDFSVEEQGS